MESLQNKPRKTKPKQKEQKRKIKNKKRNKKLIKKWRIDKENFTNLVMWITRANPHQKKKLPQSPWHHP